MMHMVQKHGGPQLIQESVAQLPLDRAACILCDTIRSRRCHRCSRCKRDTPLRDIIVGDTCQDRRQPGHQDAAPVGLAAAHHPPGGSQPVLPKSDVVITERDKQLLVDLRRASAMGILRCVVSRHATAWAESLEGAISGHQSWALLCRYRCRLLLAEVPRGSDRNAELNFGYSFGRRAGALTARGSTSKAVKGLVGGAAQGSADCRKNWTTALSSTELTLWNSSHQCGMCRGGACCMGEWQVQSNKGAAKQVSCRSRTSNWRP